jgi:hypothetical protein
MKQSNEIKEKNLLCLRSKVVKTVPNNPEEQELNVDLAYQENNGNQLIA